MKDFLFWGPYPQIIAGLAFAALVVNIIALRRSNKDPNSRWGTFAWLASWLVCMAGFATIFPMRADQAQVTAQPWMLPSSIVGSNQHADIAMANGALFTLLAAFLPVVLSAIVLQRQYAAASDERRAALKSELRIMRSLLAASCIGLLVLWIVGPNEECGFGQQPACPPHDYATWAVIDVDYKRKGPKVLDAPTPIRKCIKLVRRSHPPSGESRTHPAFERVARSCTATILSYVETSSGPLAMGTKLTRANILKLLESSQIVSTPAAKARMAKAKLTLSQEAAAARQ